LPNPNQESGAAIYPQGVGSSTDAHEKRRAEREAEAERVRHMSGAERLAYLQRQAQGDVPSPTVKPDRTEEALAKAEEALARVAALEEAR
jgi:hypothetical protein